jgi:hypothetical protein
VVLRVIARLEKEPDLKARIVSGLDRGLIGAELGQWLADGGFCITKGKSKGEKYDGASLTQFKAAVEYSHQTID